jgi:hypothetical protein
MQAGGERIPQDLGEIRRASRVAALRLAEFSPPARLGVYPLDAFDLSVIANEGLWGLLDDALTRSEVNIEQPDPEHLLRMVNAGRSDLADRFLGRWGPEGLLWPIVIAAVPEDLSAAAVHWLDAHFDMTAQFEDLFNYGTPKEVEDVLSAVNDYFELPNYDPEVAGWLLNHTHFAPGGEYFENAHPSARALERMIRAGVFKHARDEHL